MKSDLLQPDYFQRVYEKNAPVAAYHLILGILIYAMYQGDITVEEYFELYNVNAELSKNVIK